MVAGLAAKPRTCRQAAKAAKIGLVGPVRVDATTTEHSDLAYHAPLKLAGLPPPTASTPRLTPPLSPKNPWRPWRLGGKKRSACAAIPVALREPGQSPGGNL